MGTIGGRGAHRLESVPDGTAEPDERSLSGAGSWTRRGSEAGGSGLPRLIRSGDDAGGDGRRGPARHDNLPHPSSVFVGREREAEGLLRLLDASRLVTVVGPAGAGKSRLALLVAATLTSRFPGGVWQVHLAPLGDAADLPGAIAAVLPPTGAPGDPSSCSAGALGRRIGDREMLLMLDDCDHVVDASARMAEVLLESCPRLRILATSREPLAIDGEQISTLGPLSLPDGEGADRESLAGSEACRLFLRRASATSPGFTVTDSMLPTVAEICRQVDGMPLAIELAAARVASLSVDEILQRMEDPFVFLKNSRRTAHPRHRTLAAALEWSEDLLSVPQATLLRRLAVFSGWTVEAAEHVCAGGDVDQASVVDLLDALVNKSLVVAEARAPRVRFRLLLTVRRWAATMLEASGEAPDVRRAHARWYLAMAEDAPRAGDGQRRPPWTDELEAEVENLSAAVAWARTCGDPGIGARAADLLAERPARAVGATRAPVPAGARSTHGHHDGATCTCNPMARVFHSPRHSLADIEERIAFCRRTGDAKGLSHLFLTSGQAHFFLSEPRQARIKFEECVRFGRERADDEDLRGGLFGLARVAFLLGEYPTVEANADEALALAEADDDVGDAGTALAFLGDLARARGEWDAAQHLLDRAEQSARATRAPLALARTQYLRGRLAECVGGPQAQTALPLFEESLAVGRAARGPGYHEVRCLVGIGSARHAAGDSVGSAGFVLEALQQAKGLGDLHATALALEVLARLAVARGDADEGTALAHRALALHHQVGARPGVVGAIEVLAGMAVDAGRHAYAARLFGAAQAGRDADGYARGRRDDECVHAGVARLRSSLGEDAFSAAWAEGVLLQLDEAVGYAHRGRGTRDRPDSGWDSLTPAERDVVRLVADGLTNAEVGRRLFISPRTVGHHLTHVYDKLGVRSRHALAKELAGQEG